MQFSKERDKLADLVFRGDPGIGGLFLSWVWIASATLEGKKLASFNTDFAQLERIR